MNILRGNCATRPAVATYLASDSTKILWIVRRLTSSMLCRSSTSTHGELQRQAGEHGRAGLCERRGIKIPLKQRTNINQSSPQRSQSSQSDPSLCTLCVVCVNLPYSEREHSRWTWTS